MIAWVLGMRFCVLLSVLGVLEGLLGAVRVLGAGGDTGCWQGW